MSHSIYQTFVEIVPFAAIIVIEYYQGNLREEIKSVSEKYAPRGRDFEAAVADTYLAIDEARLETYMYISLVVLSAVYFSKFAQNVEEAAKTLTFFGVAMTSAKWLGIIGIISFLTIALVKWRSGKYFERTSGKRHKNTEYVVSFPYVSLDVRREFLYILLANLFPIASILISNHLV